MSCRRDIVLMKNMGFHTMQVRGEPVLCVDNSSDVFGDHIWELDKLEFISQHILIAQCIKKVIRKKILWWL